MIDKYSTRRSRSTPFDNCRLSAVVLVIAASLRRRSQIVETPLMSAPTGDATNPAPQVAEESAAMEEAVEEKEANPPNAPKAPCRQYIVDRCDGVSKHGKSRPPLKPCLPPPCLKWFPALCEQNLVCNFAGSCGVIKPDNDKMRSVVMKVALVSNVVGFILTVVACCSISLHFETLMRTAFSSGSSTSDNPNILGIEIGIGLRGVAVEAPLLGPRVWTFDQFCERGFKTGTLQYFGDGVCRGCAETSSGLVLTLILSVVTYFPNIFTDITRMYSNYDV